MDKKGWAVWEGSFKEGSGHVSAESGALKEVPYSTPMRFDNKPGTNPEELLAAAHASCFAMALSAELAKVGITPKRLHVTATISLKQTSNGFAVTASRLDLIAEIPGAEKEPFDVAVTAAKNGCPVSKLFNAPISLSSRLNE